MKKIILLMILCMVLGSVTGCISYVKVSDGVDVVEEVETTKKLGNSRVDRASQAKDKMVVTELSYAVMALLYSDSYPGLETSGKAVASDENGQINVAELFDTSTEVGQNAAKGLYDFMDLEDDKITLKSDLKNDFTLEIVELDPDSNKVVIQFISKSYGVEFYAESGKEYEGVYEK